MGKGTIISGGTDGQYQVSVVYNTDRASAEKAANLAKIANLEAQIAAETDEQKLNILKLQKLSLEKRNETLDAIPESKDVTAWCADLTEDLTGDVGLVEVPGESVAFNIQPGYNDNAAYDATRDGQLTPTLAMTPAAAFYNLAILPGWQKWKPTYRYGTITAIDGDTADVTLDAATSTQQSLGVNQESTLTGVPVEYMSCNGGAFEVGDEVLVKFTGQDWAMPVVVGFKDSPKTCSGKFIKIRVNDLMVIWDRAKNAPLDVSNIPDLVGKTWPVSYYDSDVNDWWNGSSISFLDFDYDSSWRPTTPVTETGDYYDYPVWFCSAGGRNQSGTMTYGPQESPFSGEICTRENKAVHTHTVINEEEKLCSGTNYAHWKIDQDSHICKLDFREEQCTVFQITYFNLEENRSSTYEGPYGTDYDCTGCSASSSQIWEGFGVFSQLKKGTRRQIADPNYHTSMRTGSGETNCGYPDNLVDTETNTGLFHKKNDDGDVYEVSSSYKYKNGKGIAVFGVAFGLGDNHNENLGDWQENRFVVHLGEWEDSGDEVESDGFPANLDPFAFDANTEIEQYLQNNMSDSIVNSFKFEIW